jgi:hypothetical protein
MRQTDRQCLLCGIELRPKKQISIAHLESSSSTVLDEITVGVAARIKK